MSELIVQPVLIAVLVVAEVGVFSLRVALAAKGRKNIAALLGAVNAVISVAALAQVLTNLDRPGNVAGYAVGVAVGVYLGCLADERLAGEPVEYRVVVPGDGAELAAALRARGWPLTVQAAAGIRGPATVLFVAVDAARASDVDRDLNELAPSAFRTSNRLRSAISAPLPAGYLSVGAASGLMAGAGPRGARGSPTARRAPDHRDAERGAGLPLSTKPHTAGLPPVDHGRRAVPGDSGLASPARGDPRRLAGHLRVHRRPGRVQQPAARSRSCSSSSGSSDCGLVVHRRPRVATGCQRAPGPWRWSARPGSTSSSSSHANGVDTWAPAPGPHATTRRTPSCAARSG